MCHVVMLSECYELYYISWEVFDLFVNGHFLVCFDFYFCFYNPKVCAMSGFFGNDFEAVSIVLFFTNTYLHGVLSSFKSADSVLRSFNLQDM